MKHSSGRRTRSRNNGKRHQSVKGQNFESNGPEVKVRGSAQQVLEKYLSLARDASSSGDRIAAESYLQHAEHYYRLLNTDGGQGQRGNRQKQSGQDAQPDVPEEGADAEEKSAEKDAAKAEPEAEAAVA